MNTLNERVSIFFYRISLLKIQIQNNLLRPRPARREHEAHNKNELQAYQDEVQSWLIEWRSDPTIAVQIGSTAAVLHGWADLHGSHAAFLIAAASMPTAAPAVSIPICEDIVASAGRLVRHQKKSALLRGLATADQDLLFPANWTVAHLVFSVGLALVKAAKTPSSAAGHSHASAAMRRCLTVLALLEADAGNLATGFSEIVEGLCCV